jgi:hypothetical protein
MERKQASEFDPQLLSLFHKYIHGGINRREFLDGAAKFAVGGMTAMGLWTRSGPTTRWRSKCPRRQTHQSRIPPCTRHPKATHPMARCADSSHGRRAATNSLSSLWCTRTAGSILISKT